MDRHERLLRMDISHLWHPFTQMKLWEREPPLIIEKAEGNWLIDTLGRRYFDGVSSLWVTVHGHNHPEIVQALSSQLELLDHSTLLGLSHPPAVELASMLISISPPGLTRVFYSESGSTAVEIALKMAFQFQRQTGNTEKKAFVALEGAYHGDTLGAVSVGGISLFHKTYEPLLFAVHRLPQPHCRHCSLHLRHPACGLACAETLEELLRRDEFRICALIVEPLVQGAAGIIVQPAGYLKKIWDICRKHGVLFIADEVATGFGRTGSMFACQKEGITPDIMAVGKGLSGGVLPLAATITSEKVYEAFLGEFDEFKTFFHGHTYSGNPLACAAAIANLKLMESEHLPQGLDALITRFNEAVAALADLPHVVEVRQLGLMAGVEIVADKERDIPYDPGLRMGHRVIMACRARGVIIRPLGDTLVLMPPLSSTAQEIDHLVAAVAESISEVTGR